MMYNSRGIEYESLSAVTLMLAANQTFAGSGAGPRAGFASTQTMSGRAIAHAFRHHRRNNVGTFWPGTGGYFYNPLTGEPLIDATQPPSGDVRYTYTYDLPWDWAHR